MGLAPRIRELHMQLFSMCLECFKELGHPSLEPIYVDYFDDRIASQKCSRGHKSSLLLQSQKFEVLMESGANALLQGFTLEACSSFASALERAVEFGLSVLCVAREMEFEVWARAYREMSRHSERQLGAFIVMHAICFGVPYQPNKKFIETRNRIVHKGEILDEADATAFCALAYDEIVALMTRLKNAYAAEIQACVHRDIYERPSRLGTVARATTTGTIFFNLAQSESPKPFAAALANYQDAQNSIKTAMPFMKALSAALLAKKNAVQPPAAPSSDGGGPAETNAASNG